MIESIPRSRDFALLRIRFGIERREKLGVWKVGEFGIIQAGIRNQKQEIRNDSKFMVECLGFRIDNR